MSVINQMLKDLEQQAARNGSQQAGPMPIVVANAGFARYRSKLLLLSGLIFTATAAGYWYSQAHAMTNNSAQAAARTPAIPELVAKPVTVVTPLPEVSASKSVTTVTVTAKTVPVRIATVPAGIAPVPARTEALATVPAAKTAPQIVVDTQPQLLAPQSLSLVDDEVAAEIVPAMTIKAVTRSPQQQAQLFSQQAESALLAGNKALAKERFQQALQFDKHLDQAREKLAAILYGEQRTQAAVLLLRDGLSLSPEYANFRLMLARIFLQNNDKKQAYYYLKPYRPQITEQFDYYAMLAGLAQHLGDLDVALSAYRQLTIADPNRAKWWLGLGISADKLGQTELALRSYQQAQTMGQLSPASRDYIDDRVSKLEP